MMSGKINISLCLVSMLSICVVSSYLEDDMAKIKVENVKLGRQLMMQQFYNEERIRSDGQSGVKAKRSRHAGSKTYHSDTFTHTNFLQMHDHANHEITVGMGELVGVLNGVEFRSRHNDYGLRMPSTKSKEFHATEKIPFPDVPPEVLRQSSIDEQIVEMREWFRAWKDQDHSKRDYRKYFKPVLCYLEGAWTIPIDDKVDEPFISDRHFLQAYDWLELHRKIRFMSYAGSKQNGENFAFLPTSIVDMQNDTKPLWAQWNYRILCHPLKRYIYTNRFRVVDDLAPRVAYGYERENFKHRRGVRFQLNTVNKGTFKEGHVEWEFLDDLMGEIPGKENYGKFMKDSIFGMEARKYNNEKQALNAARYHRWYVVDQEGANGRQQRHRAFADTSLFMALTSQDRIATQTVNDRCKRDALNRKYCKDTYKQKWSYAVPLEIIYLTPLGKWNPYNIEYNATAKPCPTCRGGKTKDTAYRMATSKTFYRTPAEFYSGKKSEKDASDTSGRHVGMINKNGELNMVLASGVHITLPEIEGVGALRMRYPIAPVHQEGSAVWKELQALKDLILDQSERFTKLRAEYGLNSVPSSGVGSQDSDLELTMSYAPSNQMYGVTEHTHTVELSPEDVALVKSGKTYVTRTSIGSGHSHNLNVRYNAKTEQYYYAKCDGEAECWDQHGKQMTPQK